MEWIQVLILSLGGIWVVVLSIIWIVYLSINVINETDNNLKPLVSTVIYLGILQLYFNVPIMGYIINNPSIVIIFTFLYLVVGAIWSAYKWITYILNWKKVYKKTKEYFFNLPENNNIAEDEVSENWKEERQITLSNGIMYDLRSIPSALNFKSKIIKWIVYWPFSMFLYLIIDLVRDVLEHLFNLIKSIYKKITLNILGDEIITEFKVKREDI